MTIHHDIDRVFKDGLADYSHKPPSFVWDNINQSLNSRRIKKRRNTIYSVAASGALLLSFGAGYLFNLFNTDNQQIAQQTEQHVIINKEEPKREILLASPVAISEEAEGSGIIDNNNNEATKTIERVVEDQNNNAQPKTEVPTKAKVKKVNSSGTLLPPMFATGNTYEEEETAAPVYFEEETEAKKEAQLIGMHMERKTYERQPLKKELKYEYRETPMYGEAYNEETPKMIANKWAIAISAAPLVSYRDVSNTSFDGALYQADNTSSYENGYTNEQPLVSYSVGTNVSYKLNKRWKVHSGFYVSEIGQTSKGIDLSTSLHFSANTAFDKYAINTSMGNVEIHGETRELLNSINYSASNNEASRPVDASNQDAQYNELSADLVQTLDYFEIPLLISYKVIDRKLGINVSGGISANILYDHSVYLRENGNNHTLNAEVADLKSSNYNGIIGLGMEYPIVSQLYFNLNPTLRYSLSPINNSGTVYPYSFGLYTGLKYNF